MPARGADTVSVSETVGDAFSVAAALRFVEEIRRLSGGSMENGGFLAE